MRTTCSPWRIDRSESPANGRGNCSPRCSIARAASRSRPSTASLSRLLAAFPAEAGIVPGFQPIEGRAEQELVRRTLADLMADAESCGDEGLIRDVQCLSRRLGEGGAVDYLQACARRPTRWPRSARTRRSSPMRALMELPDESVEDYIAHHCGDDRFDCELLRAVADANRKWGAPTGLGHVDVDRAVADADADRAGRGPARVAQGGADREGYARSRRARPRPSLITNRMPGASRSSSASSCGFRRRPARRRHRRRPPRGPGVRESLYPGQARGRCRRLQRPDRLDPAPARAARHGRLGALQARPSDRPCAGR